ncbi:hypothetical protein [Microvirga lotononidis]|nr:hypothetical protein [Microvirga lotononidis]WQO31459.1 hypothetical protein U0023_34830 [Microvirga lotononidis]
MNRVWKGTALLALALLTSMPNAAMAQGVPLLLFDGKTGTEFAGCLNCNRLDDASVCNRYGKFGSRYEETSIWNRYGKFGSRYEDNSPWNRYGPGLRIVDGDGRFYGNFTMSTYDRSRLSIVDQIMRLHEKLDDLEKLQDIMCD